MLTLGLALFLITPFCNQSKREENMIKFRVDSIVKQRIDSLDQRLSLVSELRTKKLELKEKVFRNKTLKEMVDEMFKDIKHEDSLSDIRFKKSLYQNELIKK